MKFSDCFCILIGISFFFACSAAGKDNIESKSVTEKKQEVWVRTLKEKADTALIYCKENDMNTDFCLLVDMRIHSGKKRFFVWDFDQDTILHSSLCAHGYGMESTVSEPVFSNVPGSYCTSLGKYKTGARSYSNWGINIHYKMHGLEETNSNAFKRIIVLHSYDLVPGRNIYPLHIPLGYSQGCPVVNNEFMKNLDMLLKDQTKPTLLWIYY